MSQIPNLGRVTPGAPERSFVCKCAEQAEVTLGRFVDTREQAVNDAWRKVLRDNQSSHSGTFNQFARMLSGAALERPHDCRADGHNTSTKNVRRLYRLDSRPWNFEALGQRE